MDRRTEDRNPKDRIQNEILELKRRYQLSSFAMNEVQKEMMTRETFTPDQAALLAATYLAYRVESWVHAARIYELRIDSGELPKESAGSELESITVTVGLGANIIADAQTGDYRSLKASLVEKGNRLLEPSEPDSNHVWGKKLLQISRQIMNIGKPFEPPMPAWKNPGIKSPIT